MYTDTTDFDQKDFMSRAKVEMRYKGLKLHEFCTATFIGQSRMRGLMSLNLKLTTVETKDIGRVLGMD